MKKKEGSLAVAEQRGASQRPVLGRPDAPQAQPEDKVQVGATRLLVDGTRVQRDRPSPATRGPPAVGHVGRADGVDVDHREGGEEDLRGNSREFHLVELILSYYDQLPDELYQLQQSFFAFFCVF